MSLRETPTFTLPMRYYKECSEKTENEIPLNNEIDQNLAQKVKAPSIYSTDLLLDDLMEGIHFFSFGIYHGFIFKRFKKKWTI